MEFPGDQSSSDMTLMLGCIIKRCSLGLNANQADETLDMNISLWCFCSSTQAHLTFRFRESAVFQVHANTPLVGTTLWYAGVRLQKFLVIMSLVNVFFRSKTSDLHGL